MRIINALKYKKSLISGTIAVLIVALVIPIIQTGFFQNNFKLWFSTMIKNPLNSLLYIIFSLVFGLMISLQVFNLKHPKLCKDCDAKKGVRTGISGGVVGLLIGICPACIGLIGFVFPLGVSLTLTYYGKLFILLAIIIMTLSIYLLGGFKKH